MANNNTLKSDIRQYIYSNQNEEITGNILRDVLLEMVDSLGDGWTYKGVATTSTNPGTPDDNVFYIATAPGTYTNFGGLSVADGEVAILKYNGSWAKDVTGAATSAQVTQLGQKLTSSVAYNENIEGKFIYPSGVIGDSDSFYILSCSLKVGYIYRIHVESKIGSTLSIAAIFNGEISTVNFISSLGSNIEDNKIHVTPN